MFIFQLFTFILVILGLVVSTRRVVVRGGIQVVRVDVEGLERGPDTGAKPVARHHNGGHQSASLWGKPGLGIGMWNVECGRERPMFVFLPEMFQIFVLSL